MSTQPLVSIVIPCYNSAAFVAEAIDSALAQTYPSVEVIVIDDGSTDDSLSVIQSYGDRVRWEAGPNRGACAARNRGIEMARGEMLQFLDSDDLLLPEKLERQVPRLMTKEADVVFCDVEVVDITDNRCLGMYSPSYSDSFEQCCYDPITCPGPLTWASNVTAVGGFNEQLPCSQERDLHIRMACLGMTFQHSAETLVTVRRRNDSLSSNYFRLLDQHKASAMAGFEILNSRDAATDHYCRTLAGLLARDARHYLREGMTEKAADYFRTAREIHAGGGLETAYSTPMRLLRSVVGAGVVERIGQWHRTANRAG